MVSDMSETFREDKGDDQVAEDQDARDEPDQVLRAHSRSTPFTTNRAKTKRAISPRYSTSSMPSNLLPRGGGRRGPNASLTGVRESQALP